MALKEVLGDSGDKDVLSSLLAKISMLQVAAGAAEANRRRLHNELVEVRGNVSFCTVDTFIALTVCFNLSHPPTLHPNLPLFP